MYTQPPAAPGLPPLPRHQQVLQQQAEAELGAELGGSSVELVVRGSNRPFAALTAAAAAGRHTGASSAAAAMEVEGQEQVNILNLPLPDIEAQAGGGEGSAHGAAAAVADLEPAQLKEAEVQVMQLEKELGTSHPEVRIQLGRGLALLPALIVVASCAVGYSLGRHTAQPAPQVPDPHRRVLAYSALIFAPPPPCPHCCRLARPTSPSPACTWRAWRRAAPSSWRWRHSAGRLRS